MRTKLLIAFGVLGVGACANVVSESSSSISVDGRNYELRTSVVEGRNGNYERSAVVVNSKVYTCLPNSPGDCSAAVRDARRESDRR